MSDDDSDRVRHIVAELGELLEPYSNDERMRMLLAIAREWGIDPKEITDNPAWWPS